MLDVSPTCTEVHVQEDGAASEWLSVESERLAPAGQGKKKHKAGDSGEAGAGGGGSAAAGAVVPVDDAWRAALKRGSVCDVQDTMKKWYQAYVVDRREEDGALAVKVQTRLEAGEGGAGRGRGAAAASRNALPSLRLLVVCTHVLRLAVLRCAFFTVLGGRVSCACACCAQVSYIGWGSKLDEWLPASSPRLARFNSRANGARGMVYVDNVVFDEELVVLGDEADPLDAVAVGRPFPRRSSFLVANVAYFLGPAQGAARFLARLKDMENPIPLDVRCVCRSCPSSPPRPPPPSPTPHPSSTPLLLLPLSPSSCAGMDAARTQMPLCIACVCLARLLCLRDLWAPVRAAWCCACLRVPCCVCVRCGRS